MHVPSVTGVKVLPLTAQTLGVLDAYVTGNDEEAVPDKLTVAPPTVGDDGALKLIVLVG